MTLFPAVEFDTSRPRLSLDGEWSFTYDPDGCGVREGWFSPDKVFPETTNVPGCAQVRPHASAGSYERLTDVALPEHSDTIMLQYGCKHDVWMQRKFFVPADWKGQTVHLHIGGVKPAGEFWLNGKPLGGTSTSRSPVRCDLTAHLNFGAENTLTARVFWPPLRLHGMFDILHAWSGLYRSVWLEAVPSTHLADVHVLTSIDPPAAQVHVTLRGETPARLRVVCEIEGDGGREYSTAAIDAPLEVPMPGAALWSPAAPHLYRATVKLFDADTLLDEGRVRFGLREIKTDGCQVLLNGAPIFLRGGCDDQIYPETVCPPCDKNFFRERIAKAKKYGFNYTKSEVEIFTDEYLQAADELGYLVCLEMPFFALGKARDIRNAPPPELADLWRRELENIVTASRNHPAVVIYSMNSETALDHENPAAFNLFSRDLPARTRRLHPGILVFDTTGAYHSDAETRHGARDTDLIEECPGRQSWPEGFYPLHGKLDISDSIDKPFILHEWSWVASLPDPRMLERYEALPLVPVQIPEMVAAACAQGVLDELPAMFRASQRLKYALRKDALESAFEHPKVAGYHHWLIHDIVYCPEGVLNEFWEEAEDLPAQKFRAYNDDTVLVLDDCDTRSFFYERAVPLGITVAHFGAAPLTGGVLRWRLQRAGEDIAAGVAEMGAVACGQRKNAMSLGIAPLAASTPAQIELHCELWDGATKVCENSWPLWFFPQSEDGEFAMGVETTQPLPLGFGVTGKSRDPLRPSSWSEVFVTHRLTDETGEPIESVLRFIENGGRVLLLPQGVLPEAASNIYRSVPYNKGSEGNMGTVIYEHPALGDFPHKGWCDFAFVPMIEGAYPMRLDVFGQKIKPIIRSIGHQVTMRDKGYLFEVGIGAGVLLACSLNLQPQCHTDPAAQYLLRSLIAYLAAGDCAPQTMLTREQLLAALPASA
jgi:hypothetical protein